MGSLLNSFDKMSKGIDKIQNDHLFFNCLCNFSKQINFMEPDEFRKLRVRLPRQPLVNQRPWWIAGMLLAFIILLFAVYSYYAHKKRSASPKWQKKISFESER
jgi:hypothetical protein